LKQPADLNEFLQALDSAYPDEVCYLSYNKPWELLFATILSAQCTDQRVNMVTPVLFAELPTLESFANADLEVIENLIKSTGFFRTKAKHLKQCAEILISSYNGELPEEMEKLTALPGVGRKTANLIRGHVFKIPSVIVDTHVNRISKRLGLTTSDDPTKAEFELMEVLPKDHWTKYNTQIIAHGRAICQSRKPRCLDCTLSAHCKKVGVDDTNKANNSNIKAEG
jgi:endonuclease-3